MKLGGSLGNVPQKLKKKNYWMLGETCWNNEGGYH
jgi:hypothetical protein